MKNLILASLLVSSAALAGAGSGAGAAGPPAGAPAAVAPMRPPAPTRITGAKAKQLMLAIKLGGVRTTKGKGKWTWTAKTMSCHSIDALADGLPDYDCQVDGKKLSGAAAFVLHEGLSNADVPVDAGMSQTHLDVKMLTCTDDQSASGGVDAMYVCEYMLAR